jgi:tetratricopeptide (TPR) repeat protein
MKRDASPGTEEMERRCAGSYWRAFALQLLLLTAVLLIVIIIFRGRESAIIEKGGTTQAVTKRDSRWSSSDASKDGDAFNHSIGRTPEEIVANKVTQFGRNRRAVVQRLAAHHGKEVPAEVEKFFEAVERGNWEEIDRLWGAMAKRSAQYEGSTHDSTLDPFWPAVLETYGAAEQAHLWPAKQLLDYSEAILGSLRPGMVYVGGTDPGRFIPTLVNETSGGEQHVILTQNAFADARYQEYIRFLYGERIQLPAQADEDRAFADYVADATKRLEHDEQFPSEPKQLRAREDVKKVEGKVQVAGFDAVMDINERILQFIVEKNPELSFAMEESFPMKSTYDGAKPLGPIFELRTGSDETSSNAAEKTAEYWRETASRIMQNNEATESPEVLKTWSKLIVSQANLLSHQQNSREAEDTYRAALQMFPRNTDAIISLSEHFSKNGRPEAALELVADFARRNPDLKPDLDRILPQFK